MLKKPYEWIVVGGLTGVVAVGLWCLFAKDVSSESHGRAASQDGDHSAVAVTSEVVPAEDVPASVVTQKQASPSLVPLPSGPLLTPVAGVQAAPPSAATPEPPPPAALPDAAPELAVDPAVARFADVQIPLEKREAEIGALAARGDAEAIRILTTLASQDVYLNRAAAEALGTIRDPAVATFLQAKLGDVNTHDVTLLCECIRSAGKVLGDEAVVAIGDVMKAARHRDDGHAVPIRAACIRTMGELRRAEAVPLLQEEIDHLCAQKRIDPAHGSEIVTAYRLIGDPRAANTLTQYADFLDQHKPSQPEPRAYFEEKIKEARDTAQQLTQETRNALDEPRN